MMQRYLTIEEAADALSVHASTIRRLLPALGAVDLTQGMGGKRLIRIPEAAITTYLRKCLILPPIPAKQRRGGAK